MAQYCIRWWGFSSENLENVVYSFNAITHGSFLAQSDSTWIKYIRLKIIFIRSEYFKS